MSAPTEGTRGWLLALALFGGLGGALLGGFLDVVLIDSGVEANRLGFVVGPWIALTGAIGLPAVKVMSDRSHRRLAKKSARRDQQASRTKPGLPATSSDPTDPSDVVRSD